jgi:hypothetical protein
LLAADCSGVVNPCIDDDVLWPHAGPSQFVAVGSTDTLAPGRLGVGLVSTYLSRPVVFHVASPGGAGSDQYAANDVVDATFLWAYGVTDRLELDLELPLTIFQQGTGLNPVTGGGGLDATATRDLRFGFTYALLRHKSGPTGATPTSSASGANGFGLAGRLEMTAPTGEPGQFAGEGFGVFVPGVSADFRAGRVLVGLEVGARIRPTAELLGARVGTQLFTAAGAEVDILPRALLSVCGEAWVLPTFAAQKDLVISDDQFTTVPDGGHIAPAEWQLSVRSAPLPQPQPPWGDLSIQLGGGGALPITGDPITQPRYRFTLGVRWAPSAGGNAPPP